MRGFQRRFTVVWAVVALALLASSLTIAGAQQTADAQVCDDIAVTAADGGRGLQAAVEAANTCSGFQIITLEAGIYDLTAWLYITDELDIVGAAGRGTQINGPESFQTFNIQDVRGTVRLRDLDVRAHASGFMYAKNATVEIINVEFSAPTGANCGVSGGPGISADNAQLTVSDSSISGAACAGVSAHSGSVVELTRVDISNGSSGVSTTGTLNITDSMIHDNTRNGIDTQSGPQITIEGSAIYANGANGISAGSGLLAVSNSTIGLAPDGSAAGNGSWGIESSFSDLRLDTVEIAHNGTGLRLAPGAANIVALESVSVRDSVGEGVHLNSGTLDIRNSTITGNKPDCTYFRGVWQDNGGNIDSDGTCGLGPANQPPVAVLPDVTVEEGSGPAPLDASGSSDPDGDEFTVSWSPNVTVTTGLQAEFADTQNEGSHVVSIEVCDQDDCTTTDATVTVNNVAPTVSVVPLNEPVAGSPARFELVLTDPGIVDTHTATVSWGHGGGEELGTVVDGSELAYSFPDPGTYSAYVEVVDDAGAFASHDFTIVVAGAGDTPPVAALTVSPESGPGPLVVTANANGSADADGDSLQYLWDDATVPVDEATRDYVFTEPGEHTVTVRAVDSTGLISDPVSRIVTVEPPIEVPGSVELTVVWHPLPGQDEPVLPLGSLDFMTEPATETTTIDMIDVHTPAQSSCDPTINGTCSATVALPATTAADGPYVIATSGIPPTWAMLLDGECAAPAGLNALDGSRVSGWFDVPPASSQQCTVTLRELTTTTAKHDTLLHITQTFEYSTPVPQEADLDPAVTQAGIQLGFPTNTAHACGAATREGSPDAPVFESGEACDVTVPMVQDTGVADISATVVTDGWATSFAGDCQGTATNEATIVVPTLASISECAITYTYVGTVVDDTALVDLTVNWVPLNSSLTPVMPLGTVEFSLTELGPVVAAVDMVDIHPVATLTCNPDFMDGGGTNGVCSATLSIATTPSDSSGYLVTTSGLPPMWATILSDDCAAAAGLNILDGTKLPGWFPVPPASQSSCTITLQELEVPTETHDGYLLVTHAFEFTSPVPPLGSLQPSTTHAGTEVEVGENCGRDLAGGEETTPNYETGEICETTIPIRQARNQPDLAASVDEPGWIASFDGDCAGTVRGEAELIAPTLASVSQCGITHTYVGEVDPNNALVDLTIQWRPLQANLVVDKVQPLGNVVFALEGVGAPSFEIAMQDVHDGNEQPCEPIVDGGNNPSLLCQAQVQLPTTPAGSDGYLVSTSGMPSTWATVLSQDCAVPTGQLPASVGKFPAWFSVTPGSAPSCTVTLHEMTLPAEQFDAYLRIDHAFVYTTPVPPPFAVTVTTAHGGSDLDLGELCGFDLGGGAGGPSFGPDGCTVTVPYHPNPDAPDVETTVDEGWNTTFGGDCVGTDNNQATIVDPTTSTISVCSVTHTYDPVVLPDLVARLVASPTIAPAPVTAVLNAGASTPAGNITSYQFDFTGEAFDSDGGSLGAVEPVTVTQPSPVLDLVLPETGAGVAWTVSVTVLDNFDRTSTAPSRPIIAGDVPPHVACTAGQQLPANECQALVDFYLATDGDNWADNEGWLNPGTPCLWLGVSCFIGHVSKIELPGNGLTGSLPESIEAFSSLGVLDLAGNSLDGDVPDAIRALSIDIDDPDDRLRLRKQTGCLVAGDLTTAFLDELDPEWDNGCYAYVDVTVKVEGPFVADHPFSVMDFEFETPFGVEVEVVEPLLTDPTWPLGDGGCSAYVDDRLGSRPTCSGRFALRLNSPDATSISVTMDAGGDLGFPTLAGDCLGGEMLLNPGDDVDCPITIYTGFGDGRPDDEFAVVHLVKQWVAPSNEETPAATINYASSAESGSLPVRALEIGPWPTDLCTTLTACFEFLDLDCTISVGACDVFLPIEVVGPDTISFSEEVPDDWTVLFGGDCDRDGQLAGVVDKRLYECTITNVHEPSGDGALVLIDWVIDKQVNALPNDLQIDAGVELTSSFGNSLFFDLVQALPPGDQPGVACQYVQVGVGDYPLTCTTVRYVDPGLYSLNEFGDQTEGLWNWDVGDECANLLFALGDGGLLRCSVLVTPDLPADYVDFAAVLSRSIVTEGDGGNAGLFEIKIELAEMPDQTVVIDWMAQPLPEPNFAPDQELEQHFGVVTIEKGELGAVLAVPIVGDGFEEYDQPFFFQLIERDFGSELRLNATIVDDDASPTVDTVYADEDEGAVPFAVEFRARDYDDPDGEVVGFRWSVYKDGEFVREIETTDDRLDQIFTEPGEYRVALIVVDDGGNISPFGDDRPSATVEATELQFEVTPDEYTEGDPSSGPLNEPFELQTNLFNNTDLLVTLEATSSPEAPEEPEIRSTCIGDTDFAASDEFTVSVSSSGSARLPIRVCDDDMPEQSGVLQFTFSDPGSGVVVGEAEVLLEDDDLITVAVLEDEVFEGGFVPTDAAVATGLRPAAVPHPFVWDVPPWLPQPTFTVEGATFAYGNPHEACLGSPVVDIVLPNESPDLYYTCGDPLPEPDKLIEIVAQIGAAQERFPIRVVDDDTAPGFSTKQHKVPEPPPGDSKVETITIDIPNPVDTPYQVLVTPMFRGGSLAVPAVLHCAGDFVPDIQLITIPANATSFDVGVEICAELLGLNPDGLFNLILSEPVLLPTPNPTDVLSNSVLAVVPVLIEDFSSGTPGVEISDAQVTEGDSGTKTVTLDVTMSGGPGPITVEWDTKLLASSTQLPAATTDDYQVSDGELTFDNPGTKTISISIKGDTIDELDEYFRVVLAEGDGYDVDDGTALVKIIDNDAARVSVDNAFSIDEGDTGDFTEMVFTITIDKEPSFELDVRFETIGFGGVTAPSVPNPATGFGPERDIEPIQGQVTFAPGDTTPKEITVLVRGDDVDEANEQVQFFLVEVGGPGAAGIDDGYATGLIFDDDEAPVISGAENQFVVLASAGLKMPVSYDVSATDDRDGTVPVVCSPASGSLFAIGTVNVTCTATDSQGLQATETFSVTVSENERSKVEITDGSPADNVDPRDVVVVTARGFKPFSPVRLELRSDPISLGSFLTDADGVVETTVVIPAGTAPGAHTIVARGVTADDEPIQIVLPISVRRQVFVSPRLTAAPSFDGVGASANDPDADSASSDDGFDIALPDGAPDDATPLSFTG